MKEFILNLNIHYPLLYVVFILLGSVMIISLTLGVVFTIATKLVITKDEDDIFDSFVNGSPEIYKPYIKVRFGSILRNMNVPFIYWRFFNIFYGMSKLNVRKWRAVIKDSLGRRRYIIFRIMVAFNHILFISIFFMILIFLFEQYFL
ncbi:TPA: hypothetical protein ACX6SP_001298 [Photobacterium damselae]